MYLWHGDTIVSNLTAMFQGDKLIVRSQIGLTNAPQSK
jgi:hypothetical protein